ncbi:hypothetical protein SDC9_158821 [bioreactor metagenome]|uniref:Uncharacterized protein n=1 Tax=bioreactor metagenome TaxID=1076179 RepID=A0A645FAX3_9ZZZZ
MIEQHDQTDQDHRQSRRRHRHEARDRGTEPGRFTVDESKEQPGRAHHRHREQDERDPPPPAPAPEAVALEADHRTDGDIEHLTDGQHDEGDFLVVGAEHLEFERHDLRHEGHAQRIGEKTQQNQPHRRQQRRHGISQILASISPLPPGNG